MSKILSVYNEWAFYEIVLPAAINMEYSFVLDAEKFHLQKNIVIESECIQGEWILEPGTADYRLEQTGSEKAGAWELPDYGRCSLVTSREEHMTILVEEKDNPLSVYRKYILYPDQRITVGVDTDNMICYRYPPEKEVNSYVSHHHCNLTYDGKKAVLEDTSSNGTYVNQSCVRGSCVLNYGDHIRIFGLSMVYLGNVLAVNEPAGCRVVLTEADDRELEKAEEKGSQSGSSDRFVFYRAPRSIPKINTETISIDPPPNPRDIPNMPLFMQIGPAMTMTIPMFLGSGMTMVASRMSGSGSSAFMFTGIITAVASAGIGTFWALMNMRFNKKRVKEEERRRFEKYGQYLEEKQSLIGQLYDEDANALREKYISSERIADYDRNNEKLWNRNFNHGDMLAYRLGTGDAPSPVMIEIPKEKFTVIEDSLAEKPKMIRDRFQIMHDVPVCIDLKANGLVGVIGDTNSWARIIKSLIVQIAGNNSYADVKIAFVYDENKISNVRIWEFVKWLPHTWSEGRKLRLFAANKDEAGEVFYALAQIMRMRREDEKSSVRPHYILFVLNKELLEGEPISGYINDAGGRTGLSTVIVAEHYEDLPNTCEFIIENNKGFAGMYSTTGENEDRRRIDFDQVSGEKLLAFAKRLANIEINETEQGGEIPNSISFFEMYGITRPQELNVAERWRKARTSETMKAMIGFKGGGAPCYLDIHERYHGPHGLVAGTTGSGKSETLQTYMLSLALNYSPDDVGFFIIDYKGGGMANLFEGLPHMIGAISNLSGNQVKRAMVSIKSENKRRQRMFSDYGVNNINAYTSLYKNGDAKEPIPHMFIIIDEFAELKREEPDFMRELVSVAQVGRSLGVHLILATQKPAGTVDDNIWSNSKFRLCLRVQDRQDSMDMLHRPDAAYLTQAGRGYLQVGNDELFELFQSGYSGAVYDEALGDKKLVVAQMLNSTGKVDLAGNHFKIKYQEEAKHRWIRLICEAVEDGIRKLPGEAADDVRCTEELYNHIYEYLEKEGIEYKRSQYNDVRLREFVELYHSAEEDSPDERADRIIQEAIKRGIRLPERKARTQLEAVNEYLAQAALSHGYNHSIRLWMPVLPEYLLLTDIEGYRDFELKNRMQEEERAWSLEAVIGKGDDPENQNQMPVSINFADNGHHVICGTVSTGKSTFLQTAVYALINKYSSEEINIYILDFSSKLLTVFEEAKQVGGIMTDGEKDEDKIAKFFTMLSVIIEERKKLLASTNYRDYVEHSHKKLAAIILVIDNYGSFKEKTNELYEDTVRQIAKEGLAYGIYLIATAGGFGMSEMPSRLADSFRTAICLEMSDIYQYSDVMRVVRSPIYPESNVKGRGLVYYGERIIEFQTALAERGESIFDRNENIKKRILQINGTDPGKNAKRIPVIPEKPQWQEYVKEEDYEKLQSVPYLLPNGYDAETAAYSTLNLTSLLTYVISGTKKSGKSTYMKTLIRACADKGSSIAVIETGSTEFSQIAQDTNSRYITDGAGIFEFAKNVLLAEAGARAGKKKECLDAHLEEDEFFAAMSVYSRICVFIPNITGFIKELYDRSSQAFQAVDVYEKLTGDKGFHYNFHFFIEVRDDEISEVSGYGFMSGFKTNGRAIRFGGKYLSQQLFNYANVPLKLQTNVLKPGIGVVQNDDKDEKLEQIVVPNYRG